jgi:Fic-DOC domain mobile mystery protein B
VTTITATSDGNTPLLPDELADLIPNLATKEELNEWERENILFAREWAIADRNSAVDMASDEYVRKLHGKMFDQTRKWAGEYRCTEKNLGVPFHDVRYWIENSTYSLDEISVRFHHRLVLIHPFPNGNGRHARLIADVVAMKLGRPEFTWGSANLVKEGEARNKYLEVIRTADNGDIQPLLKFARS